ncbi:hypothetical protein LTS08_006703 [Lithohypha guttulata]|nr:hypothetical protein LTS08_006703 [Lithohypha guttulata]
MAGHKWEDFNVLTLDGGGVRGLSTCIILQVLMQLVNEAVDPACHNDIPLVPKDIFDLVVGTSTGGLIALMLVKFGYDVSQCIELYKLLSQQIFGYTQIWGTMTLGLRWPKYSGNQMRKVIVDEVIMKAPNVQHHDAEYELENILTHQDFCCAVVCHDENSGDPVFLCSHRDELDTAQMCDHKCRHHRQPEMRVKVADAARATSAAPTYFDSIKLIGKVLIDGGFGLTNNPSKATWDHYFQKNHKIYGNIQFVNIGTGSKPRGWKEPAPSPSWRHRFRSTLIRNFKTLFARLQELATESDNVGGTMKSMALLGPMLTFDRFSADTGNIHSIQLFEFERNQEIENATRDYIETGEIENTDGTTTKVRDALQNTARRLAETYMKRVEDGRRIRPVAASSQPEIPILSSDLEERLLDPTSRDSLEATTHLTPPENTREPSPSPSLSPSSQPPSSPPSQPLDKPQNNLTSSTFSGVAMHFNIHDEPSPQPPAAPPTAAAR